MKKLSLCLIGLSLLLPLFAQQQGTVTMTFADCFTTYGEENLQVVFPYTYHGHEYTEPVSGVTQTITNVRNCDSVVTLTLTEKPAPVGAINGNAVFSVSATKKVYFSKGNLQYQASTNSYRFADHQYDYVGSRPANYTTTTWCDLFPYGTSGSGQRIGSEKVALKPYEGSYTDDYPTCNISGTCYDWGTVNPIVNGGNQAGQWRTLTISELQYLADHHNKGNVRLNNINGKDYYGLIILPDNWVWPAGISFTLSTTTKWTESYQVKVPSLSEEEWEKMETNGAVFLYCDKTSANYNSCSSSIVYYVGSYHGYQTNNLAKGFAFGYYNGGYQFKYSLSEHGDIDIKSALPIRLIQEQTNE